MTPKTHFICCKSPVGTRIRLRLAWHMKTNSPPAFVGLLVDTMEGVFAVARFTMTDRFWVIRVIVIAMAKTGSTLTHNISFKAHVMGIHAVRDFFAIFIVGFGVSTGSDVLLPMTVLAA